MKNFVTIFMVLSITAHATSAKKLLVVNGLNGGLLTGVNGVNPLLLGGLNPPVVAGGAAVIGQPPIPQFLPAAALPPYVLQPPVAPAPFGLPNAGALPYPFPPANGGLPYFVAGLPNQPAVIPPQQQVAAGQGPAGNNQAVGLPQGSLGRFKRSFIRRTTARPPVSVTQMPAQLSPTVSGNTVG
ncbi:secretory calcium-binding phosphoprotein 9 isoform X1 [Danio rerio]|uniref:Secretory calcium-binding phosphoprotein 9 n=1 Tax=Danio rerio TaxID=7955 RepID=B9UIU6_DANRE|nr:secretory calcium-binding phosphoprotein 9 precursor [Danio rerio]XP_005160118.1 secretory calcium-binding phosphoprotein 9 isoform X1 [Danio rerio]ACF33443.1 secretory calcium-binding phosphoprotein 9 [Danio rerio]|eukprot:NP_001138717.1 secretory calcium-binding phosphoprotein 9 precursor [Danio rerio]